MPIVRANASEYLLTGRAGRLQNRGSAVQAFLLPGTVYVLVPAAKQEATFEFTQVRRSTAGPGAGPGAVRQGSRTRPLRRTGRFGSVWDH